MKIISVPQPWAQLIVRGAKCIETRSYPSDYFGKVYILATPDTHSTSEQSEYLSWFISEDENLPVNAIVGSVQIKRVDPVEKIHMANYWGNAFENIKEKEIECSFGDYHTGNFAWTLEEPMEFEEPIMFEEYNMLLVDNEDPLCFLNHRMAS